MDLTYFNPNSQKEADFIASFVARQDTLDFFLKQLSLVPAGQPARHHLIVAPRGFGKTSLLRRIAIGVNSNAELNARFIPLRFREEQHNVISLDVLWRNCLQSLLEAREDEGAPQTELDELDAAWEAHAPRQGLPREQQDGEPAWHELRTRCDALERRPVLLIDNLDTLLAGLSSNHQWGLRKRLQADDGPVLIAAASRYPEATHDPEAAFYEFFRIQTLDKLDNREVFTCLRNIAKHRGDAGKQVLNLLDTEPGRVAALNTMAGGNPRTLSVLYGVLESHMSGDVLSQLSAMLDTFTGWYQARTEELPMQARAVFDALALNWDPMTAAALGLATGLETAAVSSQLSRLEKSGYVVAVALSKRRTGRTGYQVDERFFNIWYLMRNGPRRAKQSVRFLTMFLQSCFSATERRTMARAALLDQSADLGYLLALATGLPNKPLRALLLEQIGEYIPLLDELQSKSDVLAVALPTATLTAGLTIDIGSPAVIQATVQALFRSALALSASGKHEDEIAAYDKLILQVGSAVSLKLRVLLAMALVNKGIALGSLSRPEDEIEIYGQVVSRFGTASELELKHPVASALLHSGITFGELGRVDQALMAYEEVIARFSEAEELAFQELVALAMVSKGTTLGSLDRDEEGISVYEMVVIRFGAIKELALKEPVATALVNKGILLNKLGRSLEAIQAYEELLTRYRLSDEINLLEVLSRGLFNKACTLDSLGRANEAIDAYSEVIKRFGEADELSLKEIVAMALVNKGVALTSTGRLDEDVEAYDEVAARFGKATEPALRDSVARALINKGRRLGGVGRNDEAIEAFDEVVTRCSETLDPVLQAHVPQALFGRAIFLQRLNRYDESEQAYRSVVGLRPTESAAYVRLGNLLFDFGGNAQGARDVYESGLAAVVEQTRKIDLHANLAYLIALHSETPHDAQSHISMSVAVESPVSSAGQLLLSALSITLLPEPSWSRFFAALGEAVSSKDDTLWVNYADDLERLLWHILAKGKGTDFKQWMESHNYPAQYAPLYHAFVAALEGEDHLLQINPETREPASKIYAGIARRLKLYGADAGRKPKAPGLS
jgi:tetratricopeptide (TPR) repeat protein